MPIGSRGLDHIVVTVRNMDRAVNNYRRMGFQITPRMYHPFGSANNLMMFKTTFLEILGIVNASEVHGIGVVIQQLSEQREGISHFALQTTDAEADRAEFARKGLQPREVTRFERAVTLPDGEALNAVVSVCLFDQSDTPRVMMFVSQQHVAEAVWVPEWQVHPNGAEDIESVTIISDNPTVQFEHRLVSIFGREATRRSGDSLMTHTPSGAIHILTVDDFQHRYDRGGIAIEEIHPYVAAVTIRVRDLAMIDRIFADNGLEIRRSTGGGRLIAPEFANGTAIEFVDRNIAKRTEA
jgi:catechol 2,3-dioxygenase-like lactoylglutathione lyase family enzyme